MAWRPAHAGCATPFESFERVLRAGSVHTERENEAYSNLVRQAARGPSLSRVTCSIRSTRQQKARLDSLHAHQLSAASFRQALHPAQLLQASGTQKVPGYR
ncbi:hypothetical protein ACN47E_000518 [Coniothyrium glycines]